MVELRLLILFFSLFIGLLDISYAVKAVTYNGDKLTVSPSEIKTPTERRVKFQCSLNVNSSLTLHWLEPNGTDINVINSTRRYYNEKGELTIDSTQIEDSGEYMCHTNDKTLNATATLHVFKMPSYFMESMILLIINAVLVGIFLLCLGYTFIQGWRVKKQEKSERIQVL